MADSGEKTEQATPKRMKELIDKGQLSRSHDFTAWLGIGAAALTLGSVVSLGTEAATAQLNTVAAAAQNPAGDIAVEALGVGIGSLGVILTPLFLAVVTATLGGSLLQGGLRLRSPKARYDQFDLLKGVARTFGGQAMWEGVKALLKTAVVGGVLAVTIMGLMPVLVSSGDKSLSAIVSIAVGGAVSLIEAAVVAGLALAFLDVIVIGRRNRTKSRMTKKEVRDEHKSSEGDPMVRSQRRSRQLAMSRNRMISDVADADVVMVNPTHIAVALRYEPGKAAPRVVARGTDEVALRIREAAEASRVPIVKDIPLARTLYSDCTLGQEIPAELYTAVARVLAFVIALKARGTTSGIHLVPPPGTRTGVRT